MLSLSISAKSLPCRSGWCKRSGRLLPKPRQTHVQCRFGIQVLSCFPNLCSPYAFHPIYLTSVVYAKDYLYEILMGEIDPQLSPPPVPRRDTNVHVPRFRQSRRSFAMNNYSARSGEAELGRFPHLMKNETKYRHAKSYSAMYVVIFAIRSKQDPFSA